MGYRYWPVNTPNGIWGLIESIGYGLSADGMGIALTLLQHIHNGIVVYCNRDIDTRPISQLYKYMIIDGEILLYRCTVVNWFGYAQAQYCMYVQYMHPTRLGYWMDIQSYVGTSQPQHKLKFRCSQGVGVGKT